MKVRERRYHAGGMGGGGWQVRVRELPTDEAPAKGKPLPEGMAEVPAETPEHGWQPE